MPSTAARLALYQRAGGAVVPVVTALVAFVLAGLIVLATGSNPLSTYRAIFEGTGLDWPYLWVTGQDVEVASANLQQTAIATTALILTGLAVAFAFRCGLFNIGGQGQYIAGAVAAVWIGSSLSGLPAALHVILAMVIAALAGALLAGIAGLLKATLGAHEVITTIMLNWIALWVGSFLVGRSGPLVNDRNPGQPVSNDVLDEAKLPVIWGDPDFQGLHIGFFIALAALVVFWIVLNRTTLGYEVRAVGFNPEAARYGGISVPRSYFVAMAIAGRVRGPGGSRGRARLAIPPGRRRDPGIADRVHRHRRRAPRAGTLPSAPSSPRSSSGRSSPAPLAQPGRSLVPAGARREPDADHPGPRRAAVGADVLVLYLWQARRRLRRSPA